MVLLVFSGWRFTIPGISPKVDSYRVVNQQNINHQTNLSLGGGFKYFHPYLGKIPILTDIFQLG